MRLKANGQENLAKLLQNRIANEKALKDIQDQQGLALGKAVAQRKEQIALEAKIKAQKIDQQKAEIQKNAVEVQANRKLGDAKDRQDRARIRAGKEIERANKAIARAEKRGGAGDKELIEKLKKRREKNLALVLDENAKKQIDDLAKQKIDLKKDFDNQQKAVGLAEKKLKDQADKVQAGVNAGKEQLKAEADKQVAVIKGVLDARNKALEKVVETLKTQVKKVVPPKIVINNQMAGNKVNTPASASAQKVFVVNQLEQSTQDEMLRTLKGYFVNQ